MSYEIQPLKSKEMAEKQEKSTIQDVNMSPATNGIKVCYTERTEKSGKNTYDNCMYEYETEVFEMQPGESKDECFERALTRFKELWKLQNAY